MKKPEKPKYFLVLKIFGIGLVAIGVILLIIGLSSASLDMTDAGWFDNESSKMGKIFGGIICLMFGGVITFVGFYPEIHKVGIKTVKYIQSDNKEDLTNIVDTGADIVGGAITKTTRAIKKGLTENEEPEKQENSIYCKHCGSKIDANSKFCSNCGQKQ